MTVSSGCLAPLTMPTTFLEIIWLCFTAALTVIEALASGTEWKSADCALFFSVSKSRILFDFVGS
jgi:hypothetical protein